MTWSATVATARTVMVSLVACAPCAWANESRAPGASSTSLLLPPIGLEVTNARHSLADAGVDVSAFYTVDVLATTNGGKSRGSHTASMLEVFADIAFEKLAGWRGLTLHAGGYQSRGESISLENVGSLTTVSSVEGYPSTRLEELWLEHQILADVISLRIGKIRPDLEFMIAENGRTFLNSTFSWPTLAWDNIPIPFASPAVRVRFEPSSDLSLIAGLMNGDPVGPCPKGLEPAQCNPHGLNFRIGDAPFTYAEASFTYAGKGRKLAGTLKLGGWYHFGKFEDQRYDANGDSLARRDVAPLLHLGNHGLHAVIEQKLYESADAQGPRAISLFARVAGSPSDRNQIDFQADGGLLFTGVLPARSHDVFGIAAAYSRISPVASDFDRDAGEPAVRDYEAVLEISYAAELLPGFTVQPDLQYVWHPGGHATDPAEKSATADALVVGVRGGIEY